MRREILPRDSLLSVKAMSRTEGAFKNVAIPPVECSSLGLDVAKREKNHDPVAS